MKVISKQASAKQLNKTKILQGRGKEPGLASTVPTTTLRLLEVERDGGLHWSGLFYEGDDVL